MVKIFALAFGNAVFGQRGGSNLHSDGAMTDRERTILNDLVPREQKEALKRLFFKIGRTTAQLVSETASNNKYFFVLNIKKNNQFL